MEKQEYLAKAYLDYLESVSREDIIALLRPLLVELPESTLAKLLEAAKAPYVPYHFYYRQSFIERFMAINQVEVEGYISYDNSWHEPDYDRELNLEDKNLLSNVIKLIVDLHQQGEEEAYSLVTKLYQIEFKCVYHDDYDDDYEETEIYSFDDFAYGLCDIETKKILKEIRLEAMIRSRDIQGLFNFLFRSFDEKTLIEWAFRENRDLLKDVIRFAAKERKAVPNENGFLHAVTLFDDYDLFKDAAVCLGSMYPNILLRFVERYGSNSEPAKMEDIERMISEYILSIDPRSKHYLAEDVSRKLLSFCSNVELVIKYYLLWDSAYAFLMLNSLGDIPFYAYLREDDRAYLVIRKGFFAKGYEKVKDIVRAIFLRSSDHPVENEGIQRYLERARFEESQILEELEGYIIDKGINYNSKSYHYYRSFVEEVTSDIGERIDLVKSVREAYPGRPKLQKVFS